MANLYIDEALGEADFVAGGLVQITGDEARHAVRVSRLRAGEQTLIGNGSGWIGHGSVIEVDKERFAVRIEGARFEPLPALRVALVQALAKGDRDERAVEQATEFGVDAIVPWQAARSVARWNAGKAQKGALKWGRIAREASKQSLRARIPAVEELVDFETLLGLSRSNTASVLVLHPRATTPVSLWATEYASRSEENIAHEIYLVIGPEGGFTDEELDAFIGAGAAPLRLGDTVLRTSSAGPAALAVLNAALGRW